MGLAPYGNDNYSKVLDQLINVKNGKIKLNQKYFCVSKAFSEMKKNQEGDLSLGRIYTDALKDLLGEPRLRNQPLEQKYKDIARSTQVLFENVCSL